MLPKTLKSAWKGMANSNVSVNAHNLKNIEICRPLLKDFKSKSIKRAYCKFLFYKKAKSRKIAKNRKQKQ